MTFSVFGYGSLVNRRTLPPHVAVRRATLTGWRRAWRAASVAAGRGVCSLSVVPDAGSSIEGLVVTFEEAARPGLERREHNYYAVPAAGLEPAILFRANAEVDRFGDARHPVHLSYVDTVVQGFFDEFGEDGAARFMATTDGWHVPILDDRARPRYPRATALSARERRAVDALLAAVDVTIMAAEEAPSQ